MVFYHSLRLRRAAEWWISDHTCIHYINFVSYLKLVHLTLLLACNDLLGVDVAHTHHWWRAGGRSLRSVDPPAEPGDRGPCAPPGAFFLQLLKTTGWRSLLGEPIPPLNTELRFWREGGKKKKTTERVIWGVKFFSVWKSEVLNSWCWVWRLWVGCSQLPMEGCKKWKISCKLGKIALSN